MKRLTRTRWPTSKRRFHRAGGDLVGLHQPCLDRQRQPEGERDDDDQLDQAARFALRLGQREFQPAESSSESPALSGSSSSGSVGCSAVSSAACLRLGRRLGDAAPHPSSSPRPRSASAAAASASVGTTSSWLTPSASTAADSAAAGGASFDDHVLVDAPTALGDAGRLADPAAQVVELGASHVAARRDLEFLDLRRVQRERPLDADAEGLLAHGEGLTRAGALATQDDALEDLGTFAGTLDHLEVDADAVAGVEGRQALPQLGALDAVDY